MCCVHCSAAFFDKTVCLCCRACLKLPPSVSKQQRACWHQVAQGLGLHSASQVSRHTQASCFLAALEWIVTFPRCPACFITINLMILSNHSFINTPSKLNKLMIVTALSVCIQPEVVFGSSRRSTPSRTCSRHCVWEFTRWLVQAGGGLQY